MVRMPNDTGQVFDPIVQQLFSASLDLHGVLALLNRDRDSLAGQRIWSVIGRLDEAIAQIREAVVGLGGTGRTATQPVDAFLAVADALVYGAGLGDLLGMIAEHCVELFTVPAAGIILAVRGEPPAVVATVPDRTPTHDLFQLYLEGPGWEDTRGETSHTLEVSDAAARWPRFAEQAAAAGISHVHTIPLRLNDEPLGALTLLGDNTLHPADARLARGLGSLAVIAVQHEHAAKHREQFVAQLEIALTNQAIIEQAKGILAERHRVTGAEAYRMMTGNAAEHDKHLLDVARGVVDGTADLGADRSARPTLDDEAAG
jgi:hypothetical protein